MSQTVLLQTIQRTKQTKQIALFMTFMTVLFYAAWNWTGFYLAWKRVKFQAAVIEERQGMFNIQQRTFILLTTTAAKPSGQLRSFWNSA